MTQPPIPGPQPPEPPRPGELPRPVPPEPPKPDLPNGPFAAVGGN
jgi:hypothetical protein